MTTRWFTAFIFLLVALASVADDAPVKPVQGGGVVPYHEISIRLVSEEIDIHLGRDRYDVEVSYLFSNTGSATTLTMGFPNETDWMYGIAIPDFRAWVDGDEQEIYRRVYHEPDKPYGPESAPDFYYECFDLSFAAGQTRRVRNVYSQDYLIDYDMSERAARYILTTGAFWQDDIESITVRIHYDQHESNLASRMLYLDPYEVDEPLFVAGPRITPRPTGTTSDGVEIVMTNVEPDEDIEISLPMPMVGYITSSSSLESSRHYYGPENAVDDDPATSWVEGVGGAGEGETISIELTSNAAGGFILGEYEVAAVGMVNGYAASPELYRANNRVKTARLSWFTPLPHDSSSGAMTWNLDDIMTMQMYRFPVPVPMSELSIEIIDVYPGTQYDDTCIAEIVVIPVAPER